jgi:hypothetical protein
MTALELGKQLVELANAGRDSEFVDRYYDDRIVSIEGQGSEAMPARLEGIAAIRGKHRWWYDNNEIHSTRATGPFVGHRSDQFVVQFEMDVTPKGGTRMQMSEVGLFTLKNGKVVQEEFLYLMR